MDPTANLDEQLHIASLVILEGMPPQSIDRLAELVLSLNEWMLKRGTPPTQWPKSESMEDIHNRIMNEELHANTVWIIYEEVLGEMRKDVYLTYEAACNDACNDAGKDCRVIAVVL